ncbi:MAG TPA: diguanylate cyclase [Mycobacteriales bacterium]|nr:diguanylate cyclase [Mycobacteriales bacterium]
MTLRARLSLAFLLVVIAPLLVAAVVVGRGVPHALNDAAGSRLSSARAGAIALVRQTCASTRLAAEVLAREAVAGGAGGPAARAAAATRDVVTRGLADYAVVTDASGTVVGRSGRLGGGATPRPAALGSCSRGPAASTETGGETGSGAGSGIPAIADFVDVRTASGAGRGTAAVAVALDALTARRIAAATDTDVTLVAAGQVVASTEPPVTARRLATAGPTIQRAGDHSVAGRLAVAAPIAADHALVVLSVDQPGVAGFEISLVVVLLVAAALAAPIGWLLARLTTRPLAELSAAAARVAAGDLDTRIEIRGRDEVGRLARAFNEMTDELRSYVGELESSRDELRGNLARLGDTLTSTHDLGRILTVILDTAIGSVRATAGAAYVVQPERDELLLRAGRGLERRPAAPRLPMGEGVTGRVAARGEPMRGRVGNDQVHPSPLEPRANDLISVPMRSGTGVVGVLNLYDRADGAPFDAGDLEMLRTFAGQAAVALDNVLLHQEAQRLSVTDGLTGVGNYRFFQSMLSREIERAARFARPLALLMLDLDRFKNVNDEHGHQIGDAVLVELAQRVHAQVREVDILARYGGEEFVVLLPETDPEGAGHTAERICQAVRERPFTIGSLALPITVSLGVAVFPAHGDSAATLVRSADAALYAAKSGGRDGWRMAAGATADLPRPLGSQA